MKGKAFFDKSITRILVIAKMGFTPGCQMRPQKNYFHFRGRKWPVFCSQVTRFRSETCPVQLVFKKIRVNTVKNRQNQDSLGCQMRPQTFFEPKTTLKLHELSWKHYGMVLYTSENGYLLKMIVIRCVNWPFLATQGCQMRPQIQILRYSTEKWWANTSEHLYYWYKV